MWANTAYSPNSISRIETWPVSATSNAVNMRDLNDSSTSVHAYTTVYIVMAYIVMAYTVMAYTVMAYKVMALYSHGPRAT